MAWAKRSFHDLRNQKFRRGQVNQFGLPNPCPRLRDCCPIVREIDVDALTALVNALNLRAKLVYSGGVCGRWLMDHNSETSVWFHLVSKGQGWVHSPTGKRRWRWKAAT